ncbi:hypothetical protein FKP32DRAFT_1593907 [Trametes sanguinea]|nr:hypothetical protein FKP32DRAFT_1593907 [Trametes sanguinea]
MGRTAQEALIRHLTAQYGYEDSDITLMLDERRYPANLQPSKKNILHQIGRLVHGLKKNSGSRLVFYYSGHSTQIPSESIHEDDGLDEYLIAARSRSDGSNSDAVDSTFIIDNYLREQLVNPIPKGVFLTAIFDACHAGTMLDLNHYQCNAVYFPWLNRGIRHKSKSRFQLVKRENAILPTDPLERGFVRVTSLTPEEAALTNHSGRMRSASGISIFPPVFARGRKNRQTGDNMASIESVLQTPHAKKGKRPPLKRASTSQVAKEKSAKILKRVPARCYSFDHHVVLAASKVKDYLYVIMGMRQQSPEPDDPLRCTGHCTSVGDEPAYIVSISATNDAQVAFDGPQGESMTLSLIEILCS